MLNGIDVSHHNGVINFDKLFKTDTEFIIAKATQGGTFVDNQFARNMYQARKYNLLTGAYHYVTGGVDAITQSRHFMDIVNTYDDKYTLLALDVEDGSLMDMGAQLVGDMVYTMVAEIYDNMRTYPLIYASEKFMRTDTFKEVTKLCGGWIAKWGDKKPYREDLNTTIWQYSAKGTVSGIETHVDMNKAYLTPENWRKIADPEGRR